MSQIIAYSTLINQDLACVSATEAIAHIIGYTPLIRLKRFTQWTVSFGDCNHDAAKNALEQIFAKTYFLINPNKESFQFDQLSVSHSSGRTFAIAVSPKSPVRWESAQRKIEAKLGIQVQSIQAATVWAIEVDARQLNDEALKQELTEKVIVSQSVKNGILVNPISETFSWVAL